MNYIAFTLKSMDMKTAILITCLYMVFSLPVISQMYDQAAPFAHTYSIVARDPATGDMAVAVQSHWFSVGSIVSWGEAGVGVVATQSFVNPAYGTKGLALLKVGKSPQEALDQLLAKDSGREVRQVAILDVQGRVATHTGNKCIQYAGHQKGDNFSVQANMMLNATVWPEMAKAFEQNSELPLPERMIAVLKAAEMQGGDIRGKQSAVLLVVKGIATGKKWEDRVVDLRVDDHEHPIQELERLLKVFRAYEHMNNGDLAIESGDMALASKEYGAAEAMFPDNLEMQYWHAITLANNQQVDQALEMLKPIFKTDQNWWRLTQRLPEVGLLEVSEEELQQILDLVK